jgi:hypothetical protein
MLSQILDGLGIVAAWMMITTAVLVPVWVYVLSRRDQDAEHLFHSAAIVLFIFQFFHLLEHFLQVEAWWRDHSTQAMTPIAYFFERGLAIIVGHAGDMRYGMEWLHLLGNFIFMTGLYVWRRSGHNGKWARYAFNFQAVHVAEHVCLTLTMQLFGTPIGLSTLFGFGQFLPSPVGSSIRIWFHFCANMIASGMVVFSMVKGKESRDVLTLSRA